MQSTQNYSLEQKEENLVSKLLFTYLPYWPVFVLFLALFTGGAYLYLLFSTPKYEATATMIIKDERKGSDDSKMMESLDLISTKKIIENEVEVLQSRTLINSVVRKLHLYAPVYQETKFRPTSAYVTSPVLVEAVNPEEVRYFKKIYLQYDNKNNTVLLNNKFNCAINEWINTPYGTLKFIVNTKYKTPAAATPYYFSIIPIKNVALGISGNLKVIPANKLSSVINLSYKDEVPQRAEDVLNELLATYNNAAINEKNNLAKNTLSFVTDRLNIVSRELDAIERKVQQYKANRSAVDISTQGQIFLQNVGTNDQKLSDINIQLGALNQAEKFVTSDDNNSGILPSALGVNDPSLTRLMTNLYTSQLEYEKLKKTVAENNPLLVSITDQIKKLKPDILNNLQSQRKNLEASRQSLYATNGTYNSMLQSIPQKERQLLEISREQTIKSAIYSFLLQKREESALSYASTVSDSKVVDKAQSSSGPVSPNSKIIYLAAILAGLILPIGWIGAREALNRKVLYRREIEELTSIPVLGEIAYTKTVSSHEIEAGKRTFIAQEFRKIRTALPYLGIGNKTKKILVTSSIPGEGKSFIAANLAVSLSLTGKKVALIDLDLHNPSLQKILKTNEEFGVSDYLIGDKEPKDIINPSSEFENLYFISSGHLQPNPSELLENGKVNHIISYLESNFDLVIIDTAPVVSVTDAHILSGCCDATLYIVRHQYTPKMLIERIDQNNKINQLTNPAIIFNGVKDRGFVKSNYGYGYDYVYGSDQTRKDKKFLN